MKYKLESFINWFKDLPARYEQLKFTFYARYYHILYVRNRQYDAGRDYHYPEQKYDPIRLAAELIRLSKEDLWNMPIWGKHKPTGDAETMKLLRSLVVKAYKPGDELHKLGKDNE